MSEIEGWKAIGRRVVRIARQRGWTNPWGLRSKPWLLAFGAASVLAFSHAAPHTAYGAAHPHRHPRPVFVHVHRARVHHPGAPFLRLPDAPAPDAPSRPSSPGAPL